MAGRVADLATLGFVVLAVVGVLASLWEWRLEEGRGRMEGVRGTALVLLYLLVPIGALFAISYHRPKFAPRYLLPALPAFYLLVAVGLGKLASSCQPQGRGSRLLSAAAFIGLLCSLIFVGGASANSLANYYFRR
jgi:FtsH-binding integral membrane protein